MDKKEKILFNRMYSFTVLDLIAYASVKKFNLSFSGQRQDVWSKNERSLLIETMISGNPIPALTIFEDNKKQWTLLDGKQRLTSILSFFSIGDYEDKGFSLEGLSTEQEHDGKTIEELPEEIKERLLNYTVHLHIIKVDANKADDSSIAYNIFDKLNTTGKVLSMGEKRHNKLFTLVLEKSLDEDLQKNKKTVSNIFKELEKLGNFLGIKDTRAKRYEATNLFYELNYFLPKKGNISNLINLEEKYSEYISESGKENIIKLLEELTNLIAKMNLTKTRVPAFQGNNSPFSKTSNSSLYKPLIYSVLCPILNTDIDAWSNITTDVFDELKEKVIKTVSQKSFKKAWSRKPEQMNVLYNYGLLKLFNIERGETNEIFEELLGVE